MSKGRVLGGITRAHVASKAKWRLRAETLQARVTELETATTAREAHMQKEIARALMRERERERERESFGKGIERPVLLPQIERRPSFKVS